MGFIETFGKSYRQRRLELTGQESAATLEHMQSYFEDGANWTKEMYTNATGARCLVSAANHVKSSPVDDAKHWIRQAIAEVAPGISRIEDFNDTRSTFADVAAVIERAKQLAAESASRLALLPPEPVIEILPPQRRSPPPFVSKPPKPRAAPVAVPKPPRAERPRPSLASWIME
jgi:hypothetical protein